MEHSAKPSRSPQKEQQKPSANLHEVPPAIQMPVGNTSNHVEAIGEHQKSSRSLYEVPTIIKSLLGNASIKEAPCDTMAQHFKDVQTQAICSWVFV